MVDAQERDAVQKVMWYVYVIVHTMTSRFYVGFTSEPEKRWEKHKKLVKQGLGFYLHHAMRAHGIDQFNFRILQKFSTKQDALDAECFWITFFRSNEKGLGFNLTEGGECWPASASHLGGKIAGGKNLQKAWEQHPEVMLENVRKNGREVGPIAAQTWLQSYSKSEEGRRKSREVLRRYVGSTAHRAAVSASNKRRCALGRCGHQCHAHLRKV